MVIIPLGDKNASLSSFFMSVVTRISHKATSCLTTWVQAVSISDILVGQKDIRCMGSISINSNASLIKWLLFPLNWKCLKTEGRLGKKYDMTLELVRHLIQPSAAWTVHLTNRLSSHLFWYQQERLLSKHFPLIQWANLQLIMKFL